MAKNVKGRERREVTSCGTLPWRVRSGKYQVLLIKQFAHRDRWGIPKGHVNPGEGYQACALRETLEETGVQVQLGMQLPDASTSSSEERKTVKSWFAQAVGNDEPSVGDPDSEVADARWFNIDELPELVAYQRPLLEAARSLLELYRPDFQRLLDTSNASH